jgi:hypothetical protein
LQTERTSRQRQHDLGQKLILGSHPRVVQIVFNREVVAQAEFLILDFVPGIARCLGQLAV